MLSSLRSRTKLLLLTVIPLIVITALVMAVNYQSGLSTLQKELENYRTDLIDAKKKRAASLSHDGGDGGETLI